MADQMDGIAGWLASAKRGVAFTGAGISTESGIPDFRSPGGIWTRYDPRKFTYQRYVAEPEVRKLAWQVRKENWGERYEPNAGHRALARLEELGLIRGVVTQNVDGLHQDAGSHEVLELHGTSRFVRCLSCSETWPTPEVIDRVDAGEEDPSCTRCGGILKTATISFGQAMPADVVREAEQWAAEADVFLVVGSSLVVYPAAALPGVAKSSGARLVIVNREPTEHDHRADEVIHADAGPTLAAILDRVEERLAAG